jgi:hypothetical protein
VVTSGVRTPPEVEAEIIRLYQDPELSVPDVMRKTGVSGAVVSRVIREAGIPPRRGGKPSTAPGKMAQIAAACDGGMTHVQAAAACGVALGTVKRLMAARRVPGMLTAAQAAAVIGVSALAMSDLYRAGLLRAGRPGPTARLLYDAGDAAALAALRAGVTERREAAQREAERAS